MSDLLISLLRDQLMTCIICDDQYRDPRTLQCLHTFCLECLRRWSQKHRLADAVQCPTCRAVTALTEPGGISGIPKSFFIENLCDSVDRYHESHAYAEERAKIQCNQCSLRTICRSCNIFLCEHCTTEHRRDPRSADHKLFHLPEFPTPLPLPMSPSPNQIPPYTAKERRRTDRMSTEPLATVSDGSSDTATAASYSPITAASRTTANEVPPYTATKERRRTDRMLTEPLLTVNGGNSDTAAFYSPIKASSTANEVPPYTATKERRRTDRMSTEPQTAVNGESSDTAASSSSVVAMSTANEVILPYTAKERRRTHRLPSEPPTGADGGVSVAAVSTSSTVSVSTTTTTNAAATDIAAASGVDEQDLFRRSRSARSTERTHGASKTKSSHRARSVERDSNVPPPYSELATATASVPSRTYLSRPSLLHSVRGNGRAVWGVALLAGRIYVVTYCSAVMDAYDAVTYDHLLPINVEGLKDPWDLAASPSQNCLYVCDWRGKCVFSVRPGDDETPPTRSKWLQLEHRPRGIYINPLPTQTTASGSSPCSGNPTILLVCADWRGDSTNDSLRLYDSSGKRPKMLKKIRLTGLESVWQAIPEPEGYIVCHGGRWDRLHRVCRIDSEGNIKAVYGGDVGCGRTQLNIPVSIVVDSYGQVLVADYNNCRIHVLAPDLNLIRRLLRKGDGVERPRRLCLDKERGLLYIGQESGAMKIYQVADPRQTADRMLFS